MQSENGDAISLMILCELCALQVPSSRLVGNYWSSVQPNAASKRDACSTLTMHLPSA
jgi:hypothetical protein